MQIQSYGPHVTKISTPKLQTETTESKGQFANVLKQYTTDMNHDVKSAAKDAEKLAITGEGNMSETLLAMKQASLSFQLMLSARNKMMDAYREVIRMQV
ncbi:MAG TPA: flagellar hook-basal body complex protein FliE [Ghiorsea sp.]|nr:flagellar hook-basal body complex protein FliE [Ghiorsea sp.]HIP06685.1 flagellar hook-basal body complex protein FliE [Mariprofundaceae bacterium]